MKEFNFKKKYGQNFITDKNLIDKITNLISITKNDLVIEVGAGEGALTLNLVNKAKHVLIYEIDSELEFIINNKLNKYNNYTLNIQDFLDVDIKKDINNFNYERLIFVSNLPYYITTPILKKFIDNDIICDNMIIMVQEEVADRLCAKINTKDYGSLTVFINAYYDVVKAFNVSRKLFIPQPNVDSAVVVMKRKNNINIKNYDLFKRLVKDSFQFKRKTLRNNLKKYDLDIIENILVKYKKSLQNRAEDIEIDIFIEIANVLYQQ